MSSPFPAAKRNKGYDRDEVDAFLDKAREAYDAEASDAPLSAVDIRHASFTMRKSGYSTSHVDAALERLEDAFAQREREGALSTTDPEEWLLQARATAQVVLNRLSRPDGHKFHRVGKITKGYKRSEVDALARLLVGYFESGEPVSVERVRTAVFSAERGGYQEAQVDLVLDAVVDVMLAVR